MQTHLIGDGKKVLKPVCSFRSTAVVASVALSLLLLGCLVVKRDVSSASALPVMTKESSLVDRALLVSPLRNAGLDYTTLGKSGQTSIEKQIKAFDMSTVTFPIKATAQLAPKGKPCGGGAEPAPGCAGMVKLTQLDADTIEIEWKITGGGKEGLHGFHIHETSDFSNGCASAGPHYNPFNKLHGAPEDEERHVGSLGNIKVDGKGKSSGSMKDRQVKLFGPTTCVGRSVMVHADEDDLGLGDNSKANEPGPPQNGFVSKITGNAGARIACGEIVLEK
eukprot:gnl/MRDRNA2_/MRDRNA2_121926_c0_seq1.p1 gnl/MRDRNA2_/MRDRNA2_121926_c0~~gnl/MRDRNA2_/MRDRNA2_121926_c0_seq1.p1  ORF type:complete len:278 (+),score=47.32 gnl/MRDRNA2_/MRDRNA2_121926_c0_seq1:80-913(+)